MFPSATLAGSPSEGDVVKTLLFLLGLVASAHAGPYSGSVISTTTGRQTDNLSGSYLIAASSQTSSTYTIRLEGQSGSVRASSVTVTYGVVAATGAFSGAVSAGSFSGPLAGNVTGNVTGNLTGNVTGNADTATALAATPTAASSGKLCRGIAASGNCVEANVETAAASASTSPISSGALFTHAALTGSSAHGAVSANTASQIVTRDGSGNFSAGTISAALSGNATTASALAANGTNCSAGQYPLGVDASGNSETCTAAGVGDVTQSGTNNMTGTNNIVGGNYNISSNTITGQEVWIASADWTSTYITTDPFRNLISSMDYHADFVCISSYVASFGVQMGGQESVASWINVEAYCHIGGCSYGGSNTVGRTTAPMPGDGDVSGLHTPNAGVPWRCRADFGTAISTSSSSQFLYWDSDCRASMNYDATPGRSQLWIGSLWQGSVTNPYSLSFITTNTTSANGPNRPGNIRCHVDLYMKHGYRHL